MSVSTVTPATYEPVTYEQGKRHFNLAHDKDVELIQDTYLPAARQYVEDFTHQTLVQQTFDWQFADWGEVQEPGRKAYGAGYGRQLRIPLPKWPVQSVTSITYTDTGTSPLSQTVSTDVYALNATLHNAPAYLYLKYNQDWPSNRGWENDITVRFVAGYAPDTSVSPVDYAANVPKNLTLAIYMLAAEAYKNREATTEMPTFHNKLIDNLLRPHRLNRL